VGRFVGSWVGGAAVGVLDCGWGCLGLGLRDGFLVGLRDEGVTDGVWTDVTAASGDLWCEGRPSAPFSAPRPSNIAVETPAPPTTSTRLAVSSTPARLNRKVRTLLRPLRLLRLMLNEAVGSGALRR
jgi:hypothetical protein